MKIENRIGTLSYRFKLVGTDLAKFRIDLMNFVFAMCPFISEEETRVSMIS